MPQKSNSLLSNFAFALFGQGTAAPFRGYVSAIDPTVVGAGVLIGGSQNVFKKLSGNVSVRAGLKRLGAPNDTIAGVTSSYEWYTSFGAVLPLRVTEENKLQVMSYVADGITPIWYDLMTALDSTRFVFDAWWNDSFKKDTLLFVKFDNNIYSWEGGVAKLLSANTSDASGKVATMVLQATGSGYAVNDVLTIAGGTGATATVLAVSGTGAVTQIEITTFGSGYSNTSGAATTGGGGTGATITITVAVGEIGLDRDAVQAGFAPSGSVLINAHTYTYSSISGNSLLGVSGDPTVEPDGSVVLSAIITTADTPTDASDNFTNDFLKIIDNQVHIGSYNSRLIYVSSQSSFTDYTVPDVRAPGDPDLLTIDSSARGITVQKGSTDQSGNAVISGGLGDWYTVVRTNITVGDTLTEQVDVIRSQSADLATALAHEFIELVGDTILFLDQNNQLRQFGVIRNITTPVYPMLSLDVFTELQGRNFTGGHMRAVADESDITIHITAPQEGIDYLYQIRQGIDLLGNLTAERLWQPPQVRGIARIAVIDGVTYGHSNANPQIYQLWNTGQYSDDSPSDEQIPYSCHATFAYLNVGRGNYCNFDKLYFEGYATPGTRFSYSVFYEYQGAKNTLTKFINNPMNPGKLSAAFFSGADQDPSPGQLPLGQIPVGDGILTTNTDNPAKFRAIRRVQAIDAFEYAIDVWSEAKDAQWELLCLGANMQPIPRRATAIMG